MTGFVPHTLGNLSHVSGAYSFGLLDELNGSPLSNCLQAQAVARAYAWRIDDHVDADLYEGFDLDKRTELIVPEAQGWVFEGYAIPLYDPQENAGYWTFSGRTRIYTANLGWHVDTGSTSTVYLRAHCHWRMYLPSPKLTCDADGSNDPPTAPPDYTGSNTYPDVSEWRMPDRGFTMGYISYVDSPNGGVNFPIYAPLMTGSSPDWTHAGWTCTAVPSDDVLVTQTILIAGGDFKKSGQVYVAYHDPTVLDLKAETGYYFMIAVECRRGADTTSSDICCTEGCDGCAKTWIDPTSGVTIDATFPFNRIVLFACADPDFQASNIIGSPGSPDNAIVLLAPDEGTYGPLVGACPNEAYGVPHAVVTQERDKVILYVPWFGHGAEDFAHIPKRVSATYKNDDSYRRLDDPKPLPIWNEGVSNWSCFVLDVDDLRAVALLEKAQRGSADARIRAAMASGYRGEVLLADGTAGTPYGRTGVPPQWNSPAHIIGIDPHWVWVGDQLQLYFDLIHDDAGETCNCNDQLWKASRVDSVADLNAAVGARIGTSVDYTDVLKPNVELASGAGEPLYTVFLIPQDGEQFDLRQLVESSTDRSEWGDDGRLVSDPDVVVLDGGLRVSFGGGPGTGVSPGLLWAVQIDLGLHENNT